MNIGRLPVKSTVSCRSSVQCRRVKKLSRTQSAVFHTIYGGPDYTISALRACVLLRIILTELDREIAGPGWCVNADGLGGRQRAMETAQQWDRLAKNQPAEITMFQISEVQEAPAFNGGRNFLALRQTPATEKVVYSTRLRKEEKPDHQAADD